MGDEHNGLDIEMLKKLANRKCEYITEIYQQIEDLEEELKLKEIDFFKLIEVIHYHGAKLNQRNLD